MSSKRVAKAIEAARSDKADKRIPMEERIASMLVRAIPIGGPGGSASGQAAILAVPGALGMVKAKLGRAAPMVLEAHYCSSTDHARRILAEFQALHVRDDTPHARRVAINFGCEIAVWRLAGQGARMGRAHAEELAAMLAITRSLLETWTGNAERWLDDILGRARDEFREAMRAETRRIESERREKDKHLRKSVG